MLEGSELQTFVFTIDLIGRKLLWEFHLIEFLYIYKNIDCKDLMAKPQL